MFKYVQPLYLDSSAVKNSAETGISKIDLYFRGKPKRSGNKSGIVAPGVEVSIVPIYNDIPIINETDTIRPNEPTEHGARFAPRFEIARVEWDDIYATEDGSVPTSFVFSNPVFLKTKAEYGILIKYDGNEDFVLWYAKLNEHIVSTTKTFTGITEKYAGKLFSYISPINQTVSADQTSAQNIKVDNDYAELNWKPMADTSLKFKVYVARYFHSGQAVASNNTIKASPLYQTRFAADYLPYTFNGNLRIPAPSSPDEYITFDIKTSTLFELDGNELVYQNAPFFPGGKAVPMTASCIDGNNIIVANGSYVMTGGQTFAQANGWYSVFPNFRPGTPLVMDNGSNSEVKFISSIINATAVEVDIPMNWTNNASKFMITPVAYLSGIQDSYDDGGIKSMITLVKSTANSSMRFVNNSIASVSVNVGGSGYSNTDYLEIRGFENVAGKVIGGYVATANLVTNATGGITNVYLSNLGCGFVDSNNLTGANVVVLVSNGSTNSTGSSATFEIEVGTSLLMEQNKITKFNNIIVENIEADRLKPEITVNNPLGTSFEIKHKSLYYVENDPSVFSGKIVRIYANSESTTIPVKIFKSHDVGTTGIEEKYSSIIPSRSNQFVATFANGTVGNTSVVGTYFSNASIYYFDLQSNNDYIAPFFEPDIINAHFAKYIVNDDYTDEHTNYGHAYAKHVGTKVNLDKDRYAEDMLAYLTVYRPAGTDVKVYTRIHNNKDPEAFDDKDWTLLEETPETLGLYSSIVDQSDYIELTYNFPDYPNTSIQLEGSGSYANIDSVEIIGEGSNYDILETNDLVKISDPIFGQNTFAISVVNTVTNSSVFTIDKPISNIGIVGSGLIVEKIGFKNQAFNVVLNDNIVRYYNSEMAEFDGFDTFQIKLVMLSNNNSIIPKIDDIRVVAVSS